MADYFSALPESVTHHILSFLPFKEIVRTCVLSRAWNHIWCTYPNVDFVIQRDAYSVDEKKGFLDDAENSLGQCLVRKQCIQKLSLRISGFQDLDMLKPYFSCWLGLALEKNVSRLVFDSDTGGYLYCIPGELWLAKRLEVLDLNECVFMQNEFGSIRLPHLKILSLNGCQFADKSLLQQIIGGCSEVERMSISNCVSTGRFLCVSNKLHLKYLRITFLAEVERIVIDAPKLQSFSCSSRNASCVVQLANCTNITELELSHAILAHLDYYLSKCLSVDVLKLSRYMSSGKIAISSQTLKRLVFGDFYGFPYAEIDAPNLLSIELSATNHFNSKLNFNSWNVPILEDINMEFEAKCFQKACKAGLKDFIMKLPSFENVKVLIYDSYYSDVIMFEKLQAVSFSSLNKIAKESRMATILISSRDETHLVRMLLEQFAVTISIICLSRQSAQSFHKNLCNCSIVKDNYRLVELVSPGEVEKHMSYAWKLVLGSNSSDTYCSAAAIILHKRGFLDDKTDD